MKLQYITTREGLEKAFAELWTIPKLCLDTETTGLDARVHDVRLIQLCSTQADLEERVIYVIDCFKCLNLDGLKSLIESREMILGHNLNFDLQFLLQMDIDYKHKEKVTIDILKMANVSDAKINNMITVYNKIDLSPYSLHSDKQNFISAYTGYGIEKFKESLIDY